MMYQHAAHASADHGMVFDKHAAQRMSSQVVLSTG